MNCVRYAGCIPEELEHVQTEEADVEREFPLGRPKGEEQTCQLDGREAPYMNLAFLELIGKMRTGLVQAHIFFPDRRVNHRK